MQVTLSVVRSKTRFVPEKALIVYFQTKEEEIRAEQFVRGEITRLTLINHDKNIPSEGKAEGAIES